MKFSSFDEQCMRRALTLARRGEGWVEPNPMVGCVIARRDRVIGEGFHRRFGGPHAEIEALRHCKESTKGATAYVTLEPCCHVGKTGPCTKAIIKAGITKVVAAMEDPFSKVAGRGLAELANHRIKTQVGLCAAEAKLLLAPYLKRLTEKMPYVILKWAQSLDGKLGTRTGDSKWISGDASRRLVHQLRARVDAVMVGVGTVLADDPRLTARDVAIKRVALRVVVDSSLRTPPTALLFKDVDRSPVLIATTSETLVTMARKVRLLEQRGARVVPFRAIAGRVALLPLLRLLAEEGATNLLVEGGGQLFTSFLDQDLADEAWIFVAPILIGGPSAPTAYAAKGARKIPDVHLPYWVSTRTVGTDTLIRLRFFGSGPFIRK